MNRQTERKTTIQTKRRKKDGHTRTERQTGMHINRETDAQMDKVIELDLHSGSHKADRGARVPSYTLDATADIHSFHTACC